MASRPRLVLEGSKASSKANTGVRFRKSNQGGASSKARKDVLKDEENGRSSVDTTAGRGSYICDQTDFTFKVVFLGDASVGKTCLARFWVHRKVFIERTQNTIGFDHHIKEMLVGGIPIMLNLWDTAGMEQFRNALIQQYYRNVHGIVFVYDITSEESFESVDNWYAEAMKYAEHSERLKMLLIGNKKDKEEERAVMEESARRYAQSRGMLFKEVSAKDVKCLETLDDIMLSLAHQMLTDREEHSFTCSMSNVIRLEEEDWEVVEVPTGPIPRSVYQAQDENVGMSLRNQLTSSVRNVVTRTGNRVQSRNSSCSC